MKIFPAIDIKDKKCVRLVKGDFDNKTEYETSPIDQANKYKDYGFKNVSELRKAAKIGYFDSGSYITESPNGKKLKFTKNQKKMIDYHTRLKRIPRDFTKALEDTTKHLLDKKFGKNSYQIAFGGSYRRGAKDSGDIDILIKSKVFTLKEFVKLLKDCGVVFDTLSEGKDDFKG